MLRTSILVSLIIGACGAPSPPPPATPAPVPVTPQVAQQPKPPPAAWQCEVPINNEGEIEDYGEPLPIACVPQGQCAHLDLSGHVCVDTSAVWCWSSGITEPPAQACFISAKDCARDRDGKKMLGDKVVADCAETHQPGAK